jgi:hypothetical protein
MADQRIGAAGAPAGRLSFGDQGGDMPVVAVYAQRGGHPPPAGRIGRWREGGVGRGQGSTGRIGGRHHQTGQRGRALAGVRVPVLALAAKPSLG